MPIINYNSIAWQLLDAEVIRGQNWTYLREEAAILPQLAYKLKINTF